MPGGKAAGPRTCATQANSMRERAIGGASRSGNMPCVDGGAVLLPSPEPSVPSHLGASYSCRLLSGQAH